uniref:COMM domain-containing protein n=1 Tax=Ditylenchus dipsaci TaxID=166011 RepID=A0A915CU42_9BILA
MGSDNGENRAIPSTSSLNEYDSCDFRLDFNVARRSALNTNDSYSLLMELKTGNGQQTERFTLDASNLQLLSQELERIAIAFPKCYVYK